MANYNDPDFVFGWQVFPEGRVRFGGLVRGSDELGHETVAVELDGDQTFGEIRLDFMPDRNHYAIIVTSMGWYEPVMDGLPDPRFARSFTATEVERVERLIIGLVAEFAVRAKRPGFFFDPKTLFTGAVRFGDGWCLVSENAVTHE